MRRLQKEAARGAHRTVLTRNAGPLDDAHGRQLVAAEVEVAAAVPKRKTAEAFDSPASLAIKSPQPRPRAAGRHLCRPLRNNNKSWSGQIIWRCCCQAAWGDKLTGGRGAAALARASATFGCASTLTVPAHVSTSADSGAPPVRVQAHQQAPEERLACLRRLALCDVRAPAHRACLLDRGAEDREEGAQTAGGHLVQVKPSPRR